MSPHPILARLDSGSVGFCRSPAIAFPWHAKFLAGPLTGPTTLKKDKLRKQLKSSAKRRARRATSAPAVVPTTEAASVSEFDSTFHRLIARLLDVAEGKTSGRTASSAVRLSFNSRAVLSACRSFLRFGNPQDPAAVHIHQLLVHLESELSCSTKVFREAVDTLMQHASDHAAEDTLLDYLQAIRH